MLEDKKIDYIILGNHYYKTDELHDILVHQLMSFI